MSTYAPPVHVHHRPHIELRLAVIVALVAAVVAFGSWVLVDRYTGGSTTPSTATLIDKFYAAESTHDSAAVKALWTRNGMIWARGQWLSVNWLTERWIHASGVRVHRVAPVIAWGNNFATTITRPESWANPSASPMPPMIGVVQTKNGKIFRLWEFFAGSASPSINRVASLIPEHSLRPYVFRPA